MEDRLALLAEAQREQRRRERRPPAFTTIVIGDDESEDQVIRKAASEGADISGTIVIVRTFVPRSAPVWNWTTVDQIAGREIRNV